MKPLLFIVVAVSRNGVIGAKNGLPWRIPGDLARFKAITMGKSMIMGRKTFDSIGRALPGRRTIVVTRNAGFSARGVEVAPSIEAALDLVASEAEVAVVGGAEIFRALLPRVERIYLTRVDADVAGDARFPDLDAAAWRVVEEGPLERGPKDEHAHRLVVLERAASHAAL
jgi:dihydrofolate reductase